MRALCSANARPERGGTTGYGRSSRCPSVHAHCTHTFSDALARGSSIVLLNLHIQPLPTHGIRAPWCGRSLRRVPGGLRPGGRPRLQCPRLNLDACRRVRVRGGACLRKRVPCCHPPGREEAREKNDRDMANPGRLRSQRDVAEITIPERQRYLPSGTTSLHL
jgi:hypothetical protein